MSDDQEARALATLREFAWPEDKGPADTLNRTIRGALAVIKQEEMSAKRYESLRRAVLAYDAAIISCANDPDRMSSYCTVQGDSLDDLYLRMITLAGAEHAEEIEAARDQWDLLAGGDDA